MQKRLKLFKESKIIKSYTIFEYKSSSKVIYYKAKLELLNKDIVYITSNEHIYSFHWQNENGELITRQDNSSHYKSVKTYPHHKHNPNVEESFETNLNDILKTIEKKMLK